MVASSGMGINFQVRRFANGDKEKRVGTVIKLARFAPYYFPRVGRGGVVPYLQALRNQGQGNPLAVESFGLPHAMESRCVRQPWWKG
jgi:hypothetical protein